MLVGCQASIPPSLSLIFFRGTYLSASFSHSLWVRVLNGLLYPVFFQPQLDLIKKSELRNHVGTGNFSSHPTAGGGPTAAGGGSQQRADPEDKTNTGGVENRKKIQTLVILPHLFNDMSQ